MDSPKQLTTDPWGAPIPAPVANTDPWGAPVQAPAPTTADPWQSPARTVSPAQQQVSADPWGAPLAMPQAPPPYSSVAASGTIIVFVLTVFNANMNSGANFFLILLLYIYLQI